MIFEVSHEKEEFTHELLTPVLTRHDGHRQHTQ